MTPDILTAAVFLYALALTFVAYRMAVVAARAKADADKARTEADAGWADTAAALRESDDEVQRLRQKVADLSPVALRLRETVVEASAN